MTNFVVSRIIFLVPLLLGIVGFFIFAWRYPKKLLWVFIVAQALIGGFYYTNLVFFSASIKLPIFINDLFILAFLLVLAGKTVVRGEKITLLRGETLWYLLFVVFCGVSLFTTDYFSVSLNAFGKLVFWFLIYLVIVNLNLSLEEIKKAFFLMVAVAFIPLAVGVSQLFHFSRLEVPNRLNSLYVHPNVFAYYLVLLIAVCWLLHPFFDELKKRLFLLGLGLSLVCLVFTFTRGAMICLVLGLGLLFLWSGARLSEIKWFGVLFISAMVFAVLVPLLREKVLEILFEPRVATSLNWRFILWNETIKQLTSSPGSILFGKGIGTFPFYAFFGSFAAHNDYLMIWSGAGFVATAALIVFYLKMLLAGINHILMTGGVHQAIGKVFFVTVLTAAVGLTTENLILLPLFQTYFWIICGLAAQSFKLWSQTA